MKLMQLYILKNTLNTIENNSKKSRETGNQKKITLFVTLLFSLLDTSNGRVQTSTKNCYWDDLHADVRYWRIQRDPT